MKDIIKMSGPLLIFDKVNANGHLFSKDCEIVIPKTVPVLQNFECNSLDAVIGSANIIKDKKGLVCNAKISNGFIKDHLYIGGLYPADDECKMVIKEKENNND